MIQNLKCFFCGALFFAIAFSAMAQSDSTSFEKNKFVVSAGIGQSNIAATIEDITGNQDALENNSFYNFYYTSPVYNASVDYGISKKQAIGLSVAYQWLDAIPVNMNNSNYGCEKVSRLNMAFRYLHSIGNNSNKYIRGYWGLRFGFSYWKDQLPNNPIYNAFITQNPGFQAETQLGSKDEVAPSLQYLMGLQIFVTSNIGFHLEAALGSPYFLESGIDFRFGKIKK